VKQKIKVSKMDPLKYVASIPPSSQLLRLDEELLMLENEKKLNAMTEKAKAALEKG
jgi:hypothetical protein